MPVVNVIPASVLSLIFLAPPLQAMDATDVALHGKVKESRYVAQWIGPTESQLDVMESVLRLIVPEQVTTVGSAIQYLLKPYGYQLDDKTDDEESLDFYVLLTRPLPEPHRTFDPISLYDALEVLGGDSYEVVINPVLRTVRYRLKPGLQDYVSEENLNDARAAWVEGAQATSVGKLIEPLSNKVLVYGPIKSGDTLSDIVLQLGMTDFTMDQQLVQAFRANPNAFANENMNHLVIGAYLNIPLSNDKPLSPVEASRLVDEHYRLWLEQVQP
ncbi:PilL protein [Alteromonas naphthalenivorans]|uniref:PilL protein n=1 Tax=Alteromonas naphthalenivorans TaxID=715451 RepID=F5Z720_ALTNA|nr:PilL protein [Alteromonas naphthalenivorans]AEF05683.1 PilL protein [Alteromonas naphthalenivorans]